MKRTVTKTVLHPAQGSGNADLRYWLSQAISARIAALEALRQQYLQANPHVDARLQRVCRITQLKPS
jgi:hypothetical protein